MTSSPASSPAPAPAPTVAGPAEPAAGADPGLSTRPPVILHRSSEPPADGRAARSHRTIEKIIEAMLELLEQEGFLRPTAEQVASRAGVSRRAVYLHFDTLDVLFATAVERRASELFARWRPAGSDRPLAERVAWFSRAWADLVEQLIPFYRASPLQEPPSPRITHAFDEIRCWMRAAVESMFQPELATCLPDDRHRLRTALHYVTSCAAWTDLRQQGTDVQLSGQALHQLLAALLGTGASHNEEWI